MPKRKRKFGRVLHDSRSKKERTGNADAVAAAATTATAADEDSLQPTASAATPSTSKPKCSQKKLTQSQRIQMLEKKVESLSDKCAKEE